MKKAGSISASKLSMYKYTSLSSAIKIVKSGSILLNSPSKFNDPFDCAFGIDKKDSKRSFNLIFNYCAIKIILEFVNNKKISLTKTQQVIFNRVNTEFLLMKKILAKNPYYSEVPMINNFVRAMIKAHPELKIDIERLSDSFKEEMKNKVDLIKSSALISCFSKRNDSTLMWSHYADSHRGVCIEMDFPKSDAFKEVEYTNKRPHIELYNLISTFVAHDFIGKKLEYSGFKYTKSLIKPFYVKSLDWSYEEEIRCVYSCNNYGANNITYDGENYFLKNGKIKTIYIGCKAAGPKIDELITLASHRGIKIVFMKESEDAFKIIPDSSHKHIKSDIPRASLNSLLRVIDDVNSLIEKELYVQSFALALNIPAICGAKEYPDKTKKQQYIKWASEWFSQYEKSPDPSDSKMPYPSAELLFDLREKYANSGTFNIEKDYREFYLDKFILRVEGKKPFNTYLGEASVGGGLDGINHGELVINVRDFCWKLTTLGKKFYDKNISLFAQSDNLITEDYDKKMDEFTELQIINSRLKK